MKIRNGFVSNSSSSSFVLRAKKDLSKEQFIEKIKGNYRPDRIFKDVIFDDIYKKSFSVTEEQFQEYLEAAIDSLVYHAETLEPRSNFHFMNYDEFDLEQDVKQFNEIFGTKITIKEIKDFLKISDRFDKDSFTTPRSLKIREMTSNLMKEIDYTEYSIVEYSDNEGETEMEHHIMPQFNVFRISNH